MGQKRCKGWKIAEGAFYTMDISIPSVGATTFQVNFKMATDQVRDWDEPAVLREYVIKGMPNDNPDVSWGDYGFQIKDGTSKLTVRLRIDSIGKGYRHSVERKYEAAISTSQASQPGAGSSSQSSQCSQLSQSPAAIGHPTRSRKPIHSETHELLVTVTPVYGGEPAKPFHGKMFICTKGKITKKKKDDCA